jgi:hypothetical protein
MYRAALGSELMSNAKCQVSNKAEISNDKSCLLLGDKFNTQDMILNPN